ncbi:MAG: type II secretion system GspH family protein [Anaerohalosphaeraceae bacterium]|nr:type II secretion system GspH family protein [Anaerohalosphaeraceae bacterium]
MSKKIYGWSVLWKIDQPFLCVGMIVKMIKRNFKNYKNNGFTLAEAMMAMVILSIATAGLLLPFASSAAVQEEGVNRTLAVKLACDLLEDIVNTNFGDIIATYGSYTEADGAMQSAGGAGVLTGNLYAGYSRDAVCEYIYTAQQDGLDPQPNFIRITVRVHHNGAKKAEIVRLKSK